MGLRQRGTILITEERTWSWATNGHIGETSRHWADPVPRLPKKNIYPLTQLVTLGELEVNFHYTWMSNTVNTNITPGKMTAAVKSILRGDCDFSCSEEAKKAH